MVTQAMSDIQGHDTLMTTDIRLGLVIVAILYGLYRYVQQWRQFKAESLFGEDHGCRPMESRYPCKWPLGLDVLSAQYHANAEQRLLAFQQPYLDELGPNLELKILGTVGYTTYDPENVEAILSSRFEDYCMGSRRGGLYPFIGEGIFTQDGNAWEHSRQLLRRPFLKTHYQDLKGFTKHIDELIARLSMYDAGTTVDLQPLFFQLTLATTTALIFGQPIGVGDGDEKNNFSSSFDCASLVSSWRTRLQDLHWTYNPKRYRIACKRVKAYAGSFVKRTIEESAKKITEEESDRYAFVEDLAAELQDPNLIRDQLVNVLLAGRDTTACLISWTFFLLARHPKVLNRLQKVIESILEGQKEVTRLHIQKMDFLKCVLNETLRLYPPIPINVRFAQKTTWLPRGGGSDGLSPVLVRRGMGVGFVSYYMHRRKDIYGDDAMEFRPERWEESQLADIGWAYLPFHGGPRLCLGKDFALMEASCAVIRILQAFPNIRLPPEYPVVPTGQEKQDLTIFLKSGEGCQVQLK